MTFTEFSEVAGNLGSFLSALAVLATLVYLSLQVREAGRAMKLSALQADRSARRELFLSTRDSPYLPGIAAKQRNNEALTFDEEMRLGLHCSVLWGLVYSRWEHKRLGVVNDDAPDGFTMLMNRMPSAINWWKMNGELVYPSTAFREYVNTQMANMNGSTLSDSPTPVVD